MAKTRPLSLVARDPRSEENSSQRFGVSGQSVECRWKKRSGKPLETVGDPLQDQKSDILKWVDKKLLQWPLETVRERSNSKKQRDERELSNSNCTRKPLLGATSKPEFQNMAYTNHQYMTKIFQILQKKFGITAGYSTFPRWKDRKQMYWYGECSCPCRWKQPSILGRIIWRMWTYTRTRTSRRLKVYSRLLRSW